MYQVVGPKVFLAIAVWLALSIFVFLGKVGFSIQIQSLVGIVDFLLLAVITSNPVWRWVWSTKWLGPWLSKAIYPDLNGTYDATLERAIGPY